MRGYARPLADPFVQPLLVDALVRLNPGVVQSVTEAETVIQYLRACHHTPDWLTANQTFLSFL